MKVKIPIINSEALKGYRLKRIPTKSALFLGRTNTTICGGPPPVAHEVHVHAYGYQEPYGPIYKCGIAGCTTPVELVIVRVN